MNTRTFTVFALMVGGVLLVLFVTGGTHLVAAQAETTVPSVPTLPALKPGRLDEDKRPVGVPTLAGIPGGPASAAAPAATTANAQNVEMRHTKEV